MRIKTVTIKAQGSWVGTCVRQVEEQGRLERAVFNLVHVSPDLKQLRYERVA